MIVTKENSDDDFAMLLANYDEELAGGQTPATCDDVKDVTLRKRLQEAKDCLELLESVWPRNSNRRAEKSKASPFGVILPTHIGRFELRREVGRGGQGVVFEAFDPLLRRHVALKVPRPEVLTSEPLRSRFRREAEIAARLNHANLITVYEVGEDGPVSYLVTAYCQGPTLTAWLREQSKPLSPKDAARIILQLAGAVSYMHGQGVLHRDIKPSNILIDQTPAGESGAVQWIPRLTDFGLAKFTESVSQLTRTGTVLGTLSYMAPEQADGRVAAIGTHTDVYALGVVLYECLTGRPPFQDSNDASVLRRLLANDPTPISELRQDVPKDLTTICMKCLEKLPQYRYPTAEALRNDLQHFLNGEPIKARPAGTLRRLRLWARREPVFASALVFTLITLLLVTIGLSYHAKQTEESKERYRLSLEHTEQLNYLSTIQRTAQWLDFGSATNASLVMERYQQRIAPNTVLDAWDWRYLWNRTQQSPRHYLWYGHQETPYTLALSPDGTSVASGDDNGHFQVRNVNTGEITWRFDADGSNYGHPCYSKDGRYLAVECYLKSGSKASRLLLWDTKDWSLTEVGFVPMESVTSLCFHPTHDSLLVALADGGFNNYQTSRLAEWRFLEPHSVLTTLISPGYCQKIFWSQAMQSLVLVTSKEFLLLDDQCQAKGLVPGPQSQSTDSAISPNGQWLAWSDLSGRIILYDLRRSRTQPARVWNAHKGWIKKIAFSPDSSLLATCGVSNTVLLWDIKSGTQQYDCQAAGLTHGVCFSLDGKSVLFGSAEDYAVHRWYFRPSVDVKRTVQMNDQVWSAAISADSRSLVVGLDDNNSSQNIQFIDLTTGNLDVHQKLTGHDATVTGIVTLQTPDRMVTSSINGELILWDTKNGQVIRRTRTPDNHGVRTLVATNEGIATGGQEGWIYRWDADLNSCGEPWYVHGGNSIPQLLYDSKKNQLLSAGCDGKVIAWDFATRQQIKQFEAVGQARCLALSHDGQTLAYGAKQGIIYVAGRESGKVLYEIRAHSQPLCCLTFTPDDHSLISADFSGELRCWHVSSGEPLFKLPGHQGRVFNLIWNQDGSKLYSTGYDNRILEHDFQRQER